MCLTKEKAIDLTKITSRPTGKNSSVRKNPQDSYRVAKAREQAKLVPIPVDDIVGYVNEFLEVLGMEKVENPRFEIPEGLSGDELEEYLDEKLYAPMCEKHKTCEDLVWMKFTTDGFLGVVAVSNDINFDIPKDGETHLCKRTTSGIIIHSLGKVWDRSFVLAFPLVRIPEGLKRGNIECGIGNYLIDNGVPILDFYSHRH